MTEPYVDKHYQQALELAGRLDQYDLGAAERILALAQVQASLSIAVSLDSIAEALLNLDDR